MRSFFLEHEKVNGTEAVIDGSTFNHAKNVYRLKVGDNVTVTTGDNVDYECIIKEQTGSEFICEIIRKHSRNSELPIEITLYQGLPKADKMDLIVQKAVELGASRIVPVAMKRSIVKLDEKKSEHKIKRWDTIIKNAAEQSKRSVLPEITNIMTFNEAIKAAQDSFILLPYESARGVEYTREVLSGIDKKSVSIFIGPEGGFDDDEIDFAIENGAHIISLGRRILRTETAGLMLLSILTYLYEE
ncbi:MAG: 16S rRNA (uracil(1498)-N(3))-methyltransferase [Lachnospiraceae bacterium]|nr:16S rRNA (uracil(1498)-N(3))-methyltransferase [Lachnospiraceae bacterium]